MEGVPADAVRWEAAEGGVVIGRAALWRTHGAKHRLELVVEEPARGRGHGGGLFDRALDAARAARARSVQVRPNATDPRSVAFAAKRGFVETMRMHHLVLQLADARHAHLRGAIPRLAASGIAVVPYAEFRRRSQDPFAAYLACVESAREGWPDPDPDLPNEAPTPIAWARLLAERDATHVIVAEQHGQIVGFTGSFGTGVRPEVRGLGVATALKVAAIDAALARGETTLTTETGHPAMQHINDKLGFREAWCEVRMVRRLA